MGEMKIFCDRRGGTLTVWFGDPQEEYLCEETGEEVILIKDKNGTVIGFEKLQYYVPEDEDLSVSVETH
jgi:hypothetical protein